MTSPVTDKPASATAGQSPAVIQPGIEKTLNTKTPEKKIGKIQISTCETNDFLGRCLPPSFVQVKFEDGRTEHGRMFSWGVLEFRDQNGKAIAYYGGNTAIKRFIIFDSEGRPVAKIGRPYDGQKYFEIYALNDKKQKEVVGYMRITLGNRVILENKLRQEIASTEKFCSEVTMKFERDYDASPATYTYGVIDDNGNLIGLEE